jgi:hypothetical protein
MNTFDMAMDIFLVHDRPRYLVPDLHYDAQTLADVYNLKIPHAVEPKAIDDAMSTARTGIALVAQFLYVGADDYGKQFPWARPRILDPRAPGGYAFGARVTAGYYREILRRIDGDTSADRVVIGTYPDASSPLVTLDNERPDGRVVLFFGEGIDRSSIDVNTVTVRDELGNVVPATVDVFRGDTWANVITVKAGVPWQPSAKYTAVLSKSIKTLSGVSPSADLAIPFTTCTPAPGASDCAELSGPAPDSPCPETDARYVKRPGEEPEEPPDDPPPPPPPDDTPKADPTGKDAGASGGCAIEPAGRAAERCSLAALALACAALGARRARRRGGHP